MFFFCLSLFWCKLHAQHHTPRFTSNSTLNIILPHSHQTPRSLNTTPIKLATTLHQHTAPITSVHRVPTFPAGWCEIGESFPPKRRRGRKRRKNTLPIVLRSLYNCISLESRRYVKNTRPVTLTREEACPLSRLAERAEARPEGAWSRKRGGASGDKKGVWTH